MNCDLCGRETQLVRAEIEGTEMSVCRNCAQFGQLKEPTKNPTFGSKQSFKREAVKRPVAELTESITSDYAQKIRKAREELGLNQEDFSKKINEKISIVHKMETGSFEPSLPLAKKLEKILKIKLIEQPKEEAELEKPAKTTPGEFTIGDMIKTK